MRFKISIHAPTRGATESLHPTRHILRFQSTRPHGARLHDAYDKSPQAKFQSTRPHGARLAETMAKGISGFISIHAPTRGATRRHRQGADSTRISIHAPTRGATLLCILQLGEPLISIHAPTRGATVPVYTSLITAVALYFSRTSFLAVLLQAFFVAKSSV